ncbi:MAG TPA: S9 family peptidase [Allosphingosinicella sp.]|nr:S9 family peptidase [Allosphingosinicella sp.]
MRHLTKALSLPLWLLAAFVGIGAAPDAPPARIPAEDFGALPFFSKPELSPDGTRLVAGSVLAGRTSVVLADLAKADYGLKRIVLPEEAHFLWGRWAGNGKVLMSVGAKGTYRGQDLYGSRLFVYDVGTSRLDAITRNVRSLDGDNVVHIDPDGRYILLAAQASVHDYPAVLRVELDTLKSKEVVNDQSGVWSWFADPRGVVRAGLGFDGGKWWLVYRASEGGRFKTIMERDRGKQRDGVNAEGVIPVAGRSDGYVVADKQTGRFGIYRYDFDGETIGAPVFEHPQVDVDGYTYSARTGDLAAITYVDDRDRVVWLEPHMKAVQARIDRSFPNSVNRIVSRDAADRKMVVWMGGASDPGTFYIFDRSKGEMRFLAESQPSLGGKRLAPVESVTYKARDNLVIPAYLTLPAGREPKSLPLVVMPHGGPFVRDKWEFDARAQFLANRGYAVLQPNFRGSTGYGKAFADAGAGQFGRKMQDDLDDGVRWLAGRGTVDPKRVCIMGASYGGYAAMLASARNPDIYRCAISFAGISHVPPMIRLGYQGMIARRYYQDWRDRIRGDAKFDLDRVSPLVLARRIRIPLLIAHGAKDRVIPVNQSAMLHQALTRLKREHDYVVYPDEGHGFEKEANSIDFLKRVEAFLARHNPAG